MITVDTVSQCSAGAQSDDALVESAPIGTPPNQVDGGFTLAKAADGANAGEAVVLCFKVTAGDNLEQDASADAIWELRATAVSAAA